jgi:hypothetical protein
MVVIGVICREGAQRGFGELEGLSTAISGHSPHVHAGHAKPDASGVAGRFSMENPVPIRAFLFQVLTRGGER